MIVSFRVTLVGAVLASVMALAGCGSDGGNSGTGGDFPNPVDLIRKTGCEPDANVSNGELGVDGTFKVASCLFPSQMDVTVATFRSVDDLNSYFSAAQSGGPQDGRAVITVDDPLAVVTLTTNTDLVFDPEPEEIATAVSGEVQ